MRHEQRRQRTGLLPDGRFGAAEHRPNRRQCPQSSTRGPRLHGVGGSVAQVIACDLVGRRRIEARQLAERAHDHETFVVGETMRRSCEGLSSSSCATRIAQLVGRDDHRLHPPLRRGAVGQRVEHRAAPRMERQRGEAGASDRRADPHRPADEVEAAEGGGERRIGPGKAPLVRRRRAAAATVVARRRRARRRARRRRASATTGTSSTHDEMRQRRRPRRRPRRTAPRRRDARSRSSAALPGSIVGAARLLDAAGAGGRAAGRRAAAPARTSRHAPIGSQLPAWASAET